MINPKNIPPADIQKALDEAATTSVLNLEDMHLTEKQFLDWVYPFIGKHTQNLTEINLKGNTIGDQGSKVIAGLGYRLRAIDVTGNEIGKKGVNSFENLVMNARYLTSLQGIESDDKVVQEELKSKQEYAEEEFALLLEKAKEARQTGKLTVSSPSYCRKSQFEAWLFPLLDDHTITSLDFLRGSGHNKILFSNIIINALKNNTTLTTISFEGYDVNMIADMLKSNKTLQTLNLRDVLFPEELGLMEKALEHNTTLLSLGEAVERNHPTLKVLLDRNREELMKKKQRIAIVQATLKSDLIKQSELGMDPQLLHQIFALSDVDSLKQKTKSFKVEQQSQKNANPIERIVKFMEKLSQEIIDKSASGTITDE